MDNADTVSKSDPPAPVSGQADSDAKISRSGRLLGLVRRLIDYGKELLGNIRQQADAPVPEALGRGFGTLNIALIIARITRGLMIADALDRRVTQNARRLDRADPDSPPPPAAAAADTKPRKTKRPARRSPKPVLDPAADDAALLAALPTAQEIAVRVRRRPIGCVIADICSDLGIDTAHPLWREVREAFAHHGNAGFLDLIRGLARRAALPPITLPPTRGGQDTAPPDVIIPHAVPATGPP